MQNLEQKFRCADLTAAVATAKKLGAIDRGLLQQHDYFFPAPHARLKLRRINNDAAELISYRRDDSTEARFSDYTIVPIADADLLVAALTTSLGPPRELIKTRHLFIFKSTRIHIDDVKNLGTFVELETVITTQSRSTAEEELDVVVQALNLKDAVASAYVDLLNAASDIAAR
jgi:predicted adenylyl cyclase CyaB